LKTLPAWDMKARAADGAARHPYQIRTLPRGPDCLQNLADGLTVC
jgi:hypothetical protein